MEKLIDIHHWGEIPEAVKTLCLWKIIFLDKNSICKISCGLMRWIFCRFFFNYSLTIHTDFINLFSIFLYHNQALAEQPVMWALPTPGLWNKSGDFWQYNKCRWNKVLLEQQYKSGCCSSVFFSYKKSVSRSPYKTTSWLSTWFQFRHLWSTSLPARQILS